MCEQCLEDARRGMLSVSVRDARHPARPTAAELERHARRFGPEGVEQTAAELGLEVSVERPKKARQVRGLSLKARVAQLLQDGHGPEAIAEIENLSPSRARRIIEEVGK